MGTAPGPPSAQSPFQSPRAALPPRSPGRSAAVRGAGARPDRSGSRRQRAPGLSERSRSGGEKGCILSIPSSHEEQAPRQLPGEDAPATATRESLAPRNCGPFPTAVPRPFAARFYHERKVLSVVSFAPPLAPDLAWKGRRGPGGMEKGGSYLLLIYLFSSFLPQVAMVIPSSLSLRTRGDGHPSVNTPVPSATRVPRGRLSPP